MRTISLVIALACASSLGAQSPARDTACTYRTCALSITPTWNGLLVVRGTRAERMANLNFFWPGDVTRVLSGTDLSVAGADSASDQARRAVQLRQAGAIFTDLGALALGLAAADVLINGRLDRGGGFLVGGGLALIGVSVPLQFAADGALSRAVWWHNVRFTR